MQRLTEERRQEIKDRISLRQLQSWQISPDSDKARMATHLIAAYEENDRLADQLRWRLPDAELPPHRETIDVTVHGWEETGKGYFHDQYHEWQVEDETSCIWQLETKDILAWRPRPTPYTPETKEQK